MGLTFQFQQPSFVPGRRRLREFIFKLILEKKRTVGEISFVFCSDEFLLGLNKQHLQHDYYTDILTFDLSDDNNEISAEIYISTDRVRENAVSNSVTYQSELHRVIFHGILHLLGFKDKTSRDAKKMREQEDLLLKSYKV